MVDLDGADFSPGDPRQIDRQALIGPRRVSPAGPAFLAWAVIRQIGVVNFGIFTAAVGFRDLQRFGLAISAVVLLTGFARWWRFTYFLDPGSAGSAGTAASGGGEGDRLVTEAGVFRRTRTSVPLDRIQSVSTRQNLLHRVFDLVEVSVQTAGSADAEIELPAVRVEVADRLRRLATTANRAPASAVDAEDGSDEAPTPASQLPPPPPQTTPLLSRSVGDLVIVALTRNPIVLLAPIPIALSLVNANEDLADRVTGRVDSTAGAIAASVALALATSALIAVAVIVGRLFDLRLTVDKGGFRRHAGLVNRTEIAAAIERVQVVAVKQNPLERLVGQHELVLPVAGAESSGRRPGALHLPGTQTDELQQVFAQVVDPADLDVDHPLDRRTNPISPLAWQYWTRWVGLVPAAALVLLVGVAAVGEVVDAGLFLAAAVAAVAWVVATAVISRWRQQSWSWSLNPEVLSVRFGIVGVNSRVMPVRKAQTVTVRTSWFQRRHGLATVRTQTACRVRLEVPMIPLAAAHALRDELLYRSESDPRPFL